MALRSGSRIFFSYPGSGVYGAKGVNFEHSRYIFFDGGDSVSANCIILYPNCILI